MTQETRYNAIDGSVQNNSMTWSWATKIGHAVFKKRERFKLGNNKPSSTRAEQGMYLLLLQNLTEIYTRNTIFGGQHIIYVDNKQVLDHFTLPPPCIWSLKNFTR